MNTFRTNLQALTSQPVNPTSTLTMPVRDALVTLGALSFMLDVDLAEVGDGACTFTAGSGGEQLRMQPWRLAGLAQQAGEVALQAGLPDNLAAPMAKRTTAITWGDSMPFNTIVIEAAAAEGDWAAGKNRTINIVGRTTGDAPVTIFTATFTVALVAKA